MGKRYRMALLDLDGTTLRRDSTFSARTVRTVQEAARVGLLPVLCSARPPRSMKQFAAELGVEAPVIAYNGALVLDAAGEAIFRQTIQPEVAREVVRRLRQECPEANLSLECDDVWHIDRVDDPLRRALLQYRAAPPHTEGQVDEILLEDTLRIAKILFPAGANGGAICRKFEDAFGPTACFVRAGDLVEVMAAGVSKGAAAAHLCEELGIAPDEVVAFGNDYNDLPMLEFAGLAVAMANSPAPVRKIADRLAPAAEEDGVAVVLEELVGTQKR